MFERYVRKVFSRAGIAINRAEPGDIRVIDSAFYREVALRGSLGLGESYVDGLWECDAIDQLLDKLVSARIGEGRSNRFEWAITAEFDNRGDLARNAARAQVQPRIIDGRLRHLEGEIRNFQQQLERLRSGSVEP